MEKKIEAVLATSSPPAARLVRKIDAAAIIVALQAAAPQVVADELPELPEPHWKRNGSYSMEQMMTYAHAAIAAAPVQAQEPFMYGIMGPDGKAHMDENCVGPDAASLYAELNGLNDDPAAGYSIVKLFTAPVQPVAVPDGAVIKAAQALLDEHKAACLIDPMYALIEMAKDDEEASVSAVLLADLFRAIGTYAAAPAAQPSTVAVLDGLPTDEMVIRGAEQLQDCLRWAGVVHDFDADLKGTEIQQDIAESVFKSMLELAAPAAQGDTKELTDEQIKEVAINYASHVAGDVYDVTKYDCAEDFFNCVRAAIAAKAAS